jgi:hypothetical protein
MYKTIFKKCYLLFVIYIDKTSEHCVEGWEKNKNTTRIIKIIFTSTILNEMRYLDINLFK